MVKHLATFMKDKNTRGCLYRIDIKTEIEKYKRKNPKVKPKIIFDFMACLCILSEKDEWEIVTGGRQLKCVHLAKKLCEKFKEFDVELIFFLDGPVKKSKIPYYIESSNTKYETQKEVFKLVKNGEKIHFYNRSPKMSVYANNFLNTIREYSKISISFENECDLDLAHYATQNNALAVVTCDTDFLIFPGDWQIWLSNTFNLEKFETKAWNKFNLRKKLNLKPNHMPIFSTLSGNDFIKYEYVQHIHNNSHETKTRQEILAEYILKEFPRGVPLKHDLINKLVTIVYNKGNNDIKMDKAKELVIRSLNSYDYNKRGSPNLEIWLKDYTQYTNSIIPYMILKKLIITVNQSWIDMSIPEFKPFSELVIPLYRRQMGILLDHQRDKYPERELCLKPNHDEPFQIKKISPIYYDENEKTIPKLEDLLQVPNKNVNINTQDVVSLEKKLSLLSWATASSSSSSKENNLDSKILLKFCESPLFIPIICINYLVKESQISIDEADVILLSLNEAIDMNIEKLMSLIRPETITSRGFWISMVYNRLFEIIRSTLIVCGLFRYSKIISHFDGFIFHKMSKKFPTLDDEIKIKEIDRIKDYRVYV